MAAVGILLVLGIILVSMTLHELAHAYVAYWLGDDTAKQEGRLTLNPFKHLDWGLSVLLPLFLYIAKAPIIGGAKPVPINAGKLKYKEWGMALVAVAGPMMNFLLALISFLIGHFSGLMYDGGLIGLFFTEMVLANLGFMVFNLLPLPPLDGSRVVYAIAPDGVRNLMNTLEGGLGLMLVYIMILVLGGAMGTIMTKVIFSIIKGFYWLVGSFGVIIEVS